MAPNKDKLTHTLQEKNPAVDWNNRLNPASRKLLAASERLSLWLESPLVRWIGDPRFNPLYHTGTITVFLLFIILFTGIYLFLFFPFGFTASYEAVARVEANPVGHLIRALHRYASDAAVIATLLHGWRTFFQDRFRGPRWLAWLTGVGMAVVVWIIGVTGYWLIWDTRVQVINQTFFDIFNNFSSGTRFVVNQIVNVTSATDWIFILLVLVVHLGLSALTALFLWWHFKRMARAKWFPPRYWMYILGGILFLAALFVPLGMLGPANPAQAPGSTPIDLFFLAYLPAVLRQPALFWVVALVIVAILAALPWLMKRREPLHPIHLTLDQCDGCTLCERDCPYRAISMVERTDGKHHKFQAQIDPAMCVSCGICIGSCPENALSFGNMPLDPLWQQTVQHVSEAKENPVKVVFTCERHVQNGGADAILKNDPAVVIVPLTCIAMAHPNLPSQAIQAGAAEVQFIGCSPEDCANREGNLWMQQRLSAERLPKLKPAFTDKIRTAWVAPTDFKNAFKAASANQATAYGLKPGKPQIRAILALVAVLVLVAAFMLGLNNWNIQPFAPDSATLALTLAHRSGYLIKDVADQAPPDLTLKNPTRLTLVVDSVTLLDETYPMSGGGFSFAAYAFEQFQLKPGEHTVTVTMYDRPDPSAGQVIFDQAITLAPLQVLNLRFSDDSMGGDPLRGENLYYERVVGTNAGCILCHSLEPDVVLVGPSFAGIATRAATRVPGMTAEEYLHQSILDPNAYVVEGFPKGQMVQNLGEILSPDQIDDLVAFLMTLK